jgi:hypothetical protein
MLLRWRVAEEAMTMTMTMESEWEHAGESVLAVARSKDWNASLVALVNINPPIHHHKNSRRNYES